MIAALRVTLGATLCVMHLVGSAWAQTGPVPTQGTETQPSPGIIIVTPPKVPPVDAERSCPDTRSKLELMV
jgi:hypothetical protein